MDMKVEVTIDPRWRQLGARVPQTVEIAARNVEKGGKARIAAWPAVDTATTMNSIEAKPAGGFTGENLGWRVGPVTGYSPFIEFGTRYMKARPFMVPALEDERPRLIEALTQLMRELR
jgi:HK97 gp10 family phage protein